MTKNIFPIKSFLLALDEALLALLTPVTGESLERLQLLSIEVFTSKTADFHDTLVKKDKANQKLTLEFFWQQQQVKVTYFVRGLKKYARVEEITFTHPTVVKELTSSPEDISQFFMEVLGKTCDYFLDEPWLKKCGKTHACIPEMWLLAQMLKELPPEQADFKAAFIKTGSVGKNSQVQKENKAIKILQGNKALCQITVL